MAWTDQACCPHLMLADKTREVGSAVAKQVVAKLQQCSGGMSWLTELIM